MGGVGLYLIIAVVGLLLGYFVGGEFICGTLLKLGRLHRYPWERK
jgi:hypothetical protein